MLCCGWRLNASVAQAVGFETEATAIIDTLNYIRPDIHTLVIGQVCLRFCVPKRDSTSFAVT